MMENLFGSRKRAAKADAEQVATVMAEKDERIASVQRELSEATQSEKQERVRLNLVIRAARRLRHAVEIAGDSFEAAADQTTRRLAGRE
jgi:hypothetical protein